jgi:hypothetical protein
MRREITLNAPLKGKTAAIIKKEENPWKRSEEFEQLAVAATEAVVSSPMSKTAR